MAQKCGFEIFEGAKHTKVKTSSGKSVTIIPRHNSLNKHTVQGIVEDMNVHGTAIKIL